MSDNQTKETKTTGPVVSEGTEYPKTHRQSTIMLTDLFMGVSIGVMSVTPDGKLAHTDGFMRLMPTGELVITMDQTFHVENETGHRWYSDAEVLAQGHKIKHPECRWYSERVLPQMRTNFDLVLQYRLAKMMEIQDKWRREVPAVVLDRAFQLGGLEGIRNLQYNGLYGCYSLMKGSLYIGIEEDGYAHT